VLTRALTRARKVSKIEAERKGIPLFEVLEHLVGDLGQMVLQYEDLDPKESGLPQAAGADFSDERVRAWVGNWEALLPVDEATGLVWEGAWKKLSAAVRDGKLLVRAFRGGSEYSEEIKPEEFPKLWDNRYSDSYFNVDGGGHCFLEFDECNKAAIRNGHFLGASKVVWTGLCAVSGAEVLSLWPPLTDNKFDLTDNEFDHMIRSAANERGGSIGQNDAEKIVRHAMRGRRIRRLREKVRESVKRVFDNRNSGPRGPRKNRAS
jgi:hypothetical protein